MSFVNSTELAILDEVFGASGFSADATLYAALFTVVGADDGSGFTEATGGSYARVSITNNGTNFASANPKVNSTAITFPQASADWGTIRGMGFFTASSGGTLRNWSYLCDNLVRMAVGLDTGDIVWAPGHGFSNDMRVIVWAPSGSSLPTGLSAGTEYYVIGVSGSSFQLSLTQGGAAVAITADGSMMIARSRFTPVNNGDTPSFAISGWQMELD